MSTEEEDPIIVAGPHQGKRCSEAPTSWLLTMYNSQACPPNIKAYVAKHYNELIKG